ncbi:PEGA domain-containing protein [Candidatus Gottesmanbacteria bacterium]|nr:PEGA domain-containing protein [Candidatus Gottesmanbacteria bacterium]
MKQKLGFLLALGGIFLVVVGGLKFLGSRGAKQGVLKVNSTPTASIFLSNKHLGQTPYEEKVDAGDFSLKLVPESTVTPIASWEGSIKIAPNLLTFVNANLSESEFTSAVDILWLEKISSKGSEIAITTNPDGATVALDGEMKGITPLSLTTVSPGEHTVTITSPGFATRTVKLKTTAGYKVNVIVKLALSPGSEQPKEASAAAIATPTPTKGTTSTNPPKPYAVIKDTPTGFLRVRLEPSTSSTEAARVNPGDKFTIFDEKSGWFQIKYDATNKGWISAQYAEKVE